MTRTLLLKPVVGELPSDLDVLRAEAYSEGYQLLERLASEWEAGATRFDLEGEALITARLYRGLVGIGGLTLDPVAPNAWRMRRFYVRQPFCLLGFGSRRAAALLEHPRRTGQVVTVNASTAHAPPFWQALGFVPDLHDGHTHIFRLT